MRQQWEIFLLLLPSPKTTSELRVQLQKKNSFGKILRKHIGGRRGARINPVRADDGSPDLSSGGYINVPAKTGPFGWTDMYVFKTLRNTIILLEDFIDSVGSPRGGHERFRPRTV